MRIHLVMYIVQLSIRLDILISFNLQTRKVKFLQRVNDNTMMLEMFCDMQSEGANEWTETQLGFHSGLAIRVFDSAGREYDNVRVSRNKRDGSVSSYADIPDDRRREGGKIRGR